MTQWVWQVIKKVWTTEELPKDWNTSLICPIHKKWVISKTVTIIAGCTSIECGVQSLLKLYSN